MAFVPPQLAMRYGTDPVSVVLGLVGDARSKMIEVTERCADRTGLRKWTVQTGGRTYTLPMVGTRSDTVPLLATKVVAWALKAPSTFVDEGRRAAFNQPMGLEGDPPMDVPREVEAWGYMPTEEGGALTAGTVVGLIIAALPLIKVIADAVLPPLMAMVKDQLETSVRQDDAREEQPPPAPAKEEEGGGLMSLVTHPVFIGSALVAGILIARPSIVGG